MDDLFRFLLLRPADVALPEEIKTLKASWKPAGALFPTVIGLARAFADSNTFVRSAVGLTYAKAAGGVVDRIGVAWLKASDVSDLVKAATTKSAAQVVADPQFATEETNLADSLVAMKLLSDSSGADAPGLARLAQGYDAIRRAAAIIAAAPAAPVPAPGAPALAPAAPPAAGAAAVVPLASPPAAGPDAVALRALCLDDTAPPSRVSPPPPKDGRPGLPPRVVPDHTGTIKQLDIAINTLGTVPASAFHVEAAGRGSEPNTFVRLDSRLAAIERTHELPLEVRGASAAPTNVRQPWQLSSIAIATLPLEVRNAVNDAGLDLHTQSLPLVLEALHTQRTAYMMEMETTAYKGAKKLHKVGGSYSPVAENDYVGPPHAGMPSGHGNVRPIGVGDLLLVKEHVLRYEGGDLAHVENILKSESLSRETRRLERTETTVFQETETTKEETRDTQTTDRFSLKRETADTIKTDISVKAGLAVDAKYGPMVEVKANADFATSVSIESSTKQATEFSKDVVARSASKLVERVLERRSTTTISEFEEKYSHGFDNKAGAGHISGYYQWIDKVIQAQVYNYGKRLLFDVTVPEPATNFILTQTQITDQGQSLEEPDPLTINAAQITESNYRTLGAKYEVTGLEPPPPPVKTIAKGYDGMFKDDPHESSKSESLTIDEGYRAKYALFQHDWLGWDNRHWRFMIGSNWIDVLTSSSSYLTMNGEVGSVAIAYDLYKLETISATVEIFCERTERAFAAWQLKMHAAITQGYQAKRREYEQSLAQAKAAAGTVIAGRNPGFNKQVISDELRKQCITLITAQQFDAFGALELSSQGYAQPNLAATAAQMPYVRFFEQAFEWEHIIYFFYPFFWGWKDAWKSHMLLEDVDPKFGEFLRAGAARVVFPVRPGFEAAVIHYLETGEIWNGGPPPDISSPLYVPIIKEIQEATGAPGSEVAVGDPWLIHLPTTLVRIRPNNDLPTWQKVGEDWQATN